MIDDTAKRHSCTLAFLEFLPQECGPPKHVRTSDNEILSRLNHQAGHDFGGIDASIDTLHRFAQELERQGLIVSDNSDINGNICYERTRAGQDYLTKN